MSNTDTDEQFEDFDADAFMGEAVDGGMSTRLEPPPEGEYLAVTSDDPPEIRVVKTKNGLSPQLRLTWVIQDEALSEQLGRDRITVRQDIWLDFVPGTKPPRLDLGKGKNVGLGRVRAALGQNEGAWSIPMLASAGPAKIFVRHRPNEKTPEDPYTEVSRVTRPD